VVTIEIDGERHAVRTALELSPAELERVAVLNGAAQTVARRVGIDGAADVQQAAREVVSIFAPSVPLTVENCHRVMQAVAEAGVA
jgi:hypothetical protein